MLRQALFLLAATAAVPALAQDARSSADQIGRIGGADTPAIDQISAGSRRILPTPSAGPRTAAPPEQLSGEDESRRAGPQLTSEPRSTRPAAQLYRGGRTAQPSEPLSQPSEGRTGAVTPVAGKDRCDPQQGEDSGSRECDQVIETRAAEFRPPRPIPLSPEQRLIVEQKLREDRSWRVVARRLSTGDADNESMEAQGIASIVLDRPPPTRREEDTDTQAGLSAEEAAAVVDAIAEPVQPPE